MKKLTALLLCLVLCLSCVAAMASCDKTPDQPADTTACDTDPVTEAPTEQATETPTEGETRPETPPEPSVERVPDDRNLTAAQYSVLNITGTDDFGRVINPVDGKVYIDDEMKAKMEAYLAEYGAR